MPKETAAPHTRTSAERLPTSDCCRPPANRRRLAINCRRLSADLHQLRVNRRRNLIDKLGTSLVREKKRDISFPKDSPGEKQRSTSQVVGTAEACRAGGKLW